MEIALTVVVVGVELASFVHYKKRTTDQKVSGSTPDGCATRNQALTKYKNATAVFFS